MCMLSHIRPMEYSIQSCTLTVFVCIYKLNMLRLLNRGSNMSAHVLLNLLNELRKRDKMRGHFTQRYNGRHC